MSETWKVGDFIEERYEIKEIKHGGMGIVFLCIDHEDSEPIAIKTFKDEYLQNQDAIDRFKWEAEAWVWLEEDLNIESVFCETYQWPTLQFCKNSKVFLYQDLF
ncbi:MAG TPA: hypothetical protein VHY08_05270 [Bacillota bacterium]|nr:hypothetical protein [Bacillota bacterium]